MTTLTMVKTKQLSKQALILWRQVLDAPIDMPVWETTRPDVKELMDSELVTLTSEVSPKFTMDLASQCRHLRFSPTQRSLLARIAEGRFTGRDLHEWAEESKLELPLELMQQLMDINVVSMEVIRGETIYSLK